MAFVFVSIAMFAWPLWRDWRRSRSSPVAA